MIPTPEQAAKRTLEVITPALEAIALNKAKHVSISRGLLTVVDAEDYNWIISEGAWTAFQCGDNFYAGRVSTTDGYRELRMLSRLLMKPPPALVVDHRNGDSLDNRKENLRIVSRGENRRNKHNIQSNNSTGFEGVYYAASQGAWLAYISINKKRIHLGSYLTKLSAVVARIAAVEKFFGEEICRNSTLHQNNLKYLESLKEQSNQ